MEEPKEHIRYVLLQEIENKQNVTETAKKISCVYA